MNQPIEKKVRANQVFQIILSLFLIILGIVFQARQTRLDNRIWFYCSTTLLLILGVYFLLDYLINQTKKSVIPGLILCIFGCFLFLNEIHILLFRDLLFPLILLTFGITLIVYYLVSHEKIYYWSGFILLLISLVQIFLQTGLLEDPNFQKFWPLSLVLVGILLLVNYRKRQ